MTRHIDDIHVLMEIVNLTDIRPFESSARVRARPVEEQPDLETEMEFSEFTTDTEIHSRFRFTATTADAVYVSDIASVFSLSEPATVDRAVLTEFHERVGFMAAFPYIREALATAGTRLNRRAPLLDLIRPGDVKIEPPADD